MGVRFPHTDSQRFPREGQSAGGQSVPKSRLKSVVDGNQVNIPEPLWLCEGVTEKDSVSGSMVESVKAVGVEMCRKIRTLS